MERSVMERSVKPQTKKHLFFLAILVALFYAIAFNYQDGRTLTIWSVDFLDTLFEGRLPEFYQQTAENRYGLEMTQSYSQFWYLAPASLWNLPLWIGEQWFGLDLNHPLALLWGKLWFLALQIGVSYMTYRLTKQWLAAFLTFTSIFSFISAGYAGQNDFFWILMSLFALHFYFSDRRAPFMWLSLYTSLLKPWWILPFIALYFLKDKRIHRILLWFVAYVGVQVLHNLLMGNPDAHGFANPSGEMTLQRLLTSVTLPLPDGGVSVLALLIIGVYVWAYLHRGEVTKTLALRVVSGLFLALMLFSEHDFYRYVLPVPYTAMLISQMEEPQWTVTLASFTETLMAWFLVAKGTYLFQPIYMEGSALSLPPIDLTGRRFWAPWAFFRNFYESSTLRAGVLAVLLAAFVLTIWTYFKPLRGDERVPMPDWFYQLVLWLRAGIVPLLFVAMTLVTYFVPA